MTNDDGMSSREAALAAEIASLRAQLHAVGATRSAEHYPAPHTMPTYDRDQIWQVSRDMLGVADPQGNWISVNPAWTRLLEWPAADLVGHPFAAVVHPEDLDKLREGLASLQLGREAAVFENRIRARNGDYRLVSWTVDLVESRLYCVGRDITEARAAERALQDSRDFARLALSAVSGVGVWTYEVASDKFFCDAAISALYAIDADEAAAGIRRERFLANVLTEDMEALKATMAGGLVRSGDLELEYRIRHADGSIHWVLSRGHTYFDADGKPVRRTGVGIDMTQQRLLEQQLRQSQKMEAVGQLTGGMAHDFNNFLQGILIPLEVIRKRVALQRTDNLDRYFDTALSSAQKAAALTHRLLAFSRRQPLDPKLVEVNDLATAMGELLRRTMGEAIEVEFALDEIPCTTKCDANQLESALLNLSINARDAMAEGGRLTIKTSHEDIDEHYAQAQRGVIAGKYVCVSVTDTGGGMPPDVMRHAFEPFFTTKPLGRGTGLGLSMVYGFAGQSGGFATLYSHLGLGTTVRIFLPACERDGAAESLHAQARGEVRPGAGETLLIVEDDENIRKMLVELFENLDYVVLRAADGNEGLAAVESSVRIDLLLTDIGLPGLNGRLLANAARLKRPELPILFMTGYAEVAAAAGGFLDEGMHMVAKPFRVETIIERVQVILSERPESR